MPFFLAHVGHWSISASWPESKTFVERYRARYRRDADQYAAQGFTTAEILVDAVKRAQSTDRAKLRDAIAEIEWSKVTQTVPADYALAAAKAGREAPRDPAKIAQLYAVDSIPRAYLVDGDTGEVLADSGELRGETLKPAIEKALEKKRASQKN